MSDIVIGIDEVGWGCIAGPIVVCAAHVPFGHWDTLRERGFRDSKEVGNKRTRYGPGKCEQLARWLDTDAAKGMATWAIAQADPYAIERDGPGPAREKLFWRALSMLLSQNNWDPESVDVIVDGDRIITTFPDTISQTAIPKADDSIMPVSVASVIAKFQRDHQMRELHKQFPVYGWETNSGYGSEAHLAAVLKHGPVDGIHRMGYLRTQVTNHFKRQTKHFQRDHVLPKWVVDTGWVKE